MRLLLCALAATGYVNPLQTEVALYRLNSSGLPHRQAASTANNVAVRSAASKEASAGLLRAACQSRASQPPCQWRTRYASAAHLCPRVC